MLYTISGAIIGGFIAWSITKLCGITPHITSGFKIGPDSYDLVYIFCVLLGAGIGFGVGGTRLLTGHYFG